MASLHIFSQLASLHILSSLKLLLITPSRSSLPKFFRSLSALPPSLPLYPLLVNLSMTPSSPVLRCGDAGGPAPQPRQCAVTPATGDGSVTSAAACRDGPGDHRAVTARDRPRRLPDTPPSSFGRPDNPFPPPRHRQTSDAGVGRLADASR